MTNDEIKNEMDFCENRIESLINEFENESDFEIKLVKMDEAIALLKRMSDLDKLKKRNILDELKAESEKVIERLKGLL